MIRLKSFQIKPSFHSVVSIRNYYKSIELNTSLPVNGKYKSILKKKNSNRERFRKYRLANQKVISERQKNYYLKNKKEINERQLQYRQNNKETIKEQKRKFYIKHKEAWNERDRQYYTKNKKAISERHRKYRCDNQITIKERQKKYYHLNKLPSKRRNLTNLQNLREFLESMSARLYIIELSDWYRISHEQFRKVGGGSLCRTFGNLKRALQYAYPDFDWDESKFSFRGKKSRQRWLRVILEQILPEKTEILEDFLHPDLLWDENTKLKMELDIWVPKYNLALEYQVKGNIITMIFILHMDQMEQLDCIQGEM